MTNFKQKCKPHHTLIYIDNVIIKAFEDHI